MTENILKLEFFWKTFLFYLYIVLVVRSNFQVSFANNKCFILGESFEGEGGDFSRQATMPSKQKLNFFNKKSK